MAGEPFADFVNRVKIVEIQGIGDDVYLVPARAEGEEYMAWLRRWVHVTNLSRKDVPWDPPEPRSTGANEGDGHA